MDTQKLYNITNNPRLSITLLKKKEAIGLIHKVYLSQLKNSRKYTASTKIKSEVRGGGRKPWKQKGTGKARAGSSRSPLWVGGGIAFGPRPRIVKKKINKKEKRLSILASLLLKVKQIYFYQEFMCKNGFVSTQSISHYLRKEIEKNNSLLSLDKFEEKSFPRILIITTYSNYSMWLSIRNLKNVRLIQAKDLNLIQILQARHIFLENSALSIILSTYSL